MRRSIEYTVQSGRDKGKEFTITEMDAFTAEETFREALSAVYRCAIAEDQGILTFIAAGIRDAFSEPEEVSVPLPSDGSLTEDSPQIQQVKRDMQEAEAERRESAREASPAQMASLLGLRLFLQLPYAEQKRALDPLLACVTFEAMGKDYAVLENGKISPVARTYIEDPSTVLRLRAEAFKLHTDFFTPVARSIYDRWQAAALSTVPQETSPEPSPQP